MPNCKYTMRLETFDGPYAKTVAVGDPIVHVWECTNGNYLIIFLKYIVIYGSIKTFQKNFFLLLTFLCILMLLDKFFYNI